MSKDYTRTTRSRNKLNKRRYVALEVMPGHFADSKGAHYVKAPDGAMVRVRRVGEG